MSFILDALRKAERERSMGQAPTISDVALAGPGGGGGKPPRRRALWLGALIVVMAVLLVVVMVRNHREKPAPPPQAGPAEAPPAQVAAATPPAPIQDNSAQTLDDVVDEDTVDDVADEETVTAQDEQVPEDDVAADDEGQDVIAGSAPAPTKITPRASAPETPHPVARIESERPKPAVPSAAPPDAPRPVARIESERARPAAPEAPPAEAGVPPPPTADDASNAGIPPDVSYEVPVPDVAAQTAEQDVPPPPPPDVSNVKKLRDMPASFRAGFPTIKVQVHVYDPDPSKRWVLIGDRKYVEGATLSEGPRVDTIVEDGIVFEQRGEKVLYPMTR